MFVVSAFKRNLTFVTFAKSTRERDFAMTYARTVDYVKQGAKSARYKIVMGMGTYPTIFLIFRNQENYVLHGFKPFLEI